jgi:hypothetical protein
MDWKEFLKPTLEKGLLFVVVYLLFMPLHLCIWSEWFSTPSPSGNIGSCSSALKTIIADPAGYLIAITLGLLYFGSNDFYTSLWLGLLVSYLLACLLFHFYSKTSKRKKSR